MAVEAFEEAGGFSSDAAERRFYWANVILAPWSYLDGLLLDCTALAGPAADTLLLCLRNMQQNAKIILPCPLNKASFENFNPLIMLAMEARL